MNADSAAQMILRPLMLAKVRSGRLMKRQVWYYQTRSRCFWAIFNMIIIGGLLNNSIESGLKKVNKDRFGISVAKLPVSGLSFGGSARGKT